MTVKQKEKPNIPLCDVSLSHMTPLHSSFQKDGFDYFCGKLSVTFFPLVSADDMTALSTDSMTVGGHVLNSGAEILLLERRHRPEAMAQIKIESDVAWIQQQILVRVNV